MNCPGIEPPRKPSTVHRADLFGNVANTRQTEAELNGWRETQAQLFERDDYRPKPEPDIDPRQGALL